MGARPPATVWMIAPVRSAGMPVWTTGAPEETVPVDMAYALHPPYAHPMRNAIPMYRHDCRWMVCINACIISSLIEDVRARPRLGWREILSDCDLHASEFSVECNRVCRTAERQ